MGFAYTIRLETGGILSLMGWGISVFNQIIAFGYHSLYFFSRYCSIQYNGIPMLLIHMIRRHHRRISISPEFHPFRIAFYIDPDAVIFFININKTLFIFFASHNCPIVIMEWIIFICIRKRFTVLNDFFSCYQLFQFPFNITNMSERSFHRDHNSSIKNSIQHKLIQR